MKLFGSNCTALWYNLLRFQAWHVFGDVPGFFVCMHLTIRFYIHDCPIVYTNLPDCIHVTVRLYILLLASESIYFQHWPTYILASMELRRVRIAPVSWRPAG